ncbi:MAG: VCBS repeat-containing protein, partial [Thermoplasmata archaeon]|nr:VCBS repeat-containing protein [Thermoplasmata archaeon]
STDSMVFLQDGTDGFCATTPDHLLPTKGARAVAAGDLDGDGHVDLVFANGRAAGFPEIDSYVYWGKAGGGFDATPGTFATKGAEDVKVADLNDDTHLDVVFANKWDNSQDHNINSFVYLNDGAGGFPTTPSATLPTVGAVAVTIADLDGAGRKDLVFACPFDGATHNVSTVAYLGGASMWSASPDIVIPTEGASDVAAAHAIAHGSGGYISNPIRVDERDVGSFHTFRYDAMMGASVSGKVQLVDGDTWEVLAEADLTSGPQEWSVEGLFKVKAHPSIRVLLTLSGLEGGSFGIDDLWLNWTERIERPPEVLDFEVSAVQVYRNEVVHLWINVNDEYDLLEDLVVTVQHRLNGTQDSWDTHLVRALELKEGVFEVTIAPKMGAPIGMYDFRVTVLDTDAMYS